MSPAAQTSVRAFAPATVANVACAFDVLGFAVEHPGDAVIATFTETPGVVIERVSGDGGKLPLDPSKNTAGVAVSGLLAHLGEKRGAKLAIEKDMPLGSGLGSSAASAAAALVAANALCGNQLKTEQLLPFALEAERVACGTAHADNVAPALLGGFVLIRSYTPLDIVRIPSPPLLHCCVIHPHIEIRTEDARKVLKKQIPLKNAVVQWGNIAGLIAALYSSDYTLLGRSLQDVIIEPERSLLIPGFKEVKQAALQCGALGCSISGSGPSIFALTSDRATADKAAKKMAEEFSTRGIASDIFVSGINTRGAHVIDGAHVMKGTRP